eukprot:g1991.t1
MQELEKMKAMTQAMAEENEKLQKSGGGAGDSEEVQRLREELAKAKKEKEEDEARMAAMPEELDHAKAMRASANSTVSDLEKRIEKAKELGEDDKVKSLEAELVEAKKKRAEEEKALEAAKAKLASASKGGTTTDLEALESKLAEETRLAEEAAAAKAKASEADSAMQAAQAQAAEAQRQMEEMKKMLEMKQAELMSQMTESDAGAAEAAEREKKQQQQRHDYAARGMGIVAYEPEQTEPYLLNLDEDPFRSERYIYWLKHDHTVFGPGGQVRPFSVNCKANHCTIHKTGDGSYVLEGGDGPTFYNGKVVKKGKKYPLKAWDRVVIGGDVLQMMVPGASEDDPNKVHAETAISEYQEALSEERRKKTGVSADQEKDLQDRLAQFEEEKKQWDAKMKAMRGKATAEEEAAMREEERKRKKEMEKLQMQVMNGQIIQLLPKLKELKILTDTMDRSYLSYEAKLLQAHSHSGKLELKVRVHNGNTQEDTLIDTFELDKAYNVLKEEHRNLSMAIENNREYTVPDHHDPVLLLFDNTFHLGTSILFPEFLLGYMLATDEEEQEQFVDIKNSMALSKHIGKLTVVWTPLEPDDLYGEGEELDVYIEDPEELLGKPWTYKIEIKVADGLPLAVDVAFVQYNFFGELFVTETVEEVTHSPQFNYSYVHHVDAVTEEFIEWLKEPMEFHLHVSPVVETTGDTISTSNPHISATLSGKVSSFATKSDLIKKISKLENEKTALEKKLTEAVTELKEWREGRTPKKQVKLD